MAASFALFFSTPAQSYYLPPISNAQMYTLATMGNVRALRAAIQRGLNIDTLDRYGNTALCHAVKQRNYTAYNTLRAAGANPHHPCMRNIVERNYDSFMGSRRVVPTTANSRDAYAYLGEEDYFLSTRTWLIGGAILLGGALALLLGGGGGGGNDVFYPLTYNETDFSLGGTAGTSTPNKTESGSYNKVILLEQFGGTITNGSYPDYNFGDGKKDGWVISNDSSINVMDADGNKTSQLLTDMIDFRHSALDYSNYIQVAMKGINKSTVNNGYSQDSSRYDPDKNYVITLKNNTAGLVALNNSTANNYDTIRIDAKNGTLAMIASKNSTAVNHTDAQISMSFKGDKDNHSVTGMYADTGSAIINNGTISGTTRSADSTAGFMVGMRGQIINQEYSPYSKTTLTNNGNITLSASADNREIRTGLVGMGSYLEQEFLDGDYLLSRAGSITMNNTGNITLNVSLTGENGNYSATDSEGNNLFNQGLGGIVGIRADANTTATNSGNIQINITDNGDESKTVSGSHAGMFSIRNGVLINNKYIGIDGGIGGYGIIAVRGEGKNPEIDSDSPVLTNNGIIEIDSKNGFGIASFNGGHTLNAGSITLKKQGTGIQHDTGLIENNAAVTLEKGGTGLKMTQEGSITTGKESSIYIDNALENETTSSGTEDAGEAGSASTSGNGDASIGIYQEKGSVNNNGTITIVNTESTDGTIAYGIQTKEGNISNNNIISITDNDKSYGITIENGNVVNTDIISLTNSKGALDSLAYGIKSTRGDVTNSGAISLFNKDESYAIEALAGTISNSGNITVNTDNNLTSKLAYGIKGGSTNISNKGTIIINNADESYGISTENGSITNDAALTLGNSTGALDAKAYGIKSTRGNVTNNANITVSNKNEAYAIAADAGNVVNNGELNINNNTGAVSNIAYAIKGGVGSVTNNKDITISNANEEYGITVENGVVTNNADITLNNTQQAQNKTSYGIKAEKGSVINNGNLYINTTGDLSQGIDLDTGSFGIWGNEASIYNSEKSQIVFTKRGNGMHTESGQNQNYGIIHMQAGGVGMSTASGNAVNRGTGTITIDDSGTGMKSGLGQAVNEGQINITGSLSTGMESENYAQNDGIINITGYNSKGMSVTAENAQIINNNDIVMSSEHNGLYNYGMYGANGVYSRMTNNGNITITGRQYPTTENIAYGMHLDEGEAKNYGTITLDDMFGYGMNLGTGGTLDNYAQIVLNYGGVGMGANGAGATENETAAAINHEGGVITINGERSYGMQMLGSATAWNDGTITVDGEKSYGISTTDGSGTNTSSITMAAAESVGMHSTNADSINKASGVITIQGENSVGMQTENGGTSSTSLVGASNEGTINLEASSTGSTGMKVTGSGTARNKGTINVMSSSSSGMLADSSGTIDNSGTIDVTGDSSYGMQATEGTATNNKEIIIDSDDSYGMYANGGTIVNGMNGTITINDDNNSIYAMYVLDGAAENNGTLSFTKEGIIAMYARAGTAVNNKIINLSGAKSIAMQGEGEAQLTNNKDITISGDGSTGMDADGNSTTTNEIDGVITVNGPNSYGMVAHGVILGESQTQGTAVNSGTITVTDASSIAMYADGGIIQNTSTGEILTDGSIGMYVNRGQGINEGIIENENGNFKAMYATAGSIENRGRITLSGDNSIGMEVNGSATASNSLENSEIEITGANSIGMKATQGTATNYGIINANNATAVAMQADGGTIINEDGATLRSIGEVAMLVNAGAGINRGSISLDTDGITAMRVKTGTITNEATGSIVLNGSNAVGMDANGAGTAQNDGTISVSGEGAKAMLASGAGNAVNNGQIDVQNANGYAMYADGGTITNGVKGIINTLGSSAMYVDNGGVAINNGEITNNNEDFHAIHLADGGSATNNGTITLGGANASGIYVESGGATITNNKTIEVNGSSNLYGINAINGGSSTISNVGTITVSVSGATGVGIAASDGSIDNSGTIQVSGDSGIGIQTKNAGVTNNGTINVDGNSSTIGIQSTGSGSLTNNSKGVITVTGTGSRGMASAGGSIRNDGTMTISGTQSVGLYSNGGTIINENSGSVSVSGGESIGIQVVGGGSATNKGTLTVEGAYGMYASGGSSITNTGTITLNNGSYGMYASGSGSSASNTGLIEVNGGSVTLDNAMTCVGGASCVNNGTVIVNGETKMENGVEVSETSSETRSVSTNSLDTFTIGPVGNFTVKNMSGTLRIDKSVIAEGMQTSYVVKNALTTDSVDKIDVKGTAWFRNTQIVKNDEEVKIPTTAEPSQDVETNEASVAPKAQAAAASYSVSPLSASVQETSPDEESLGDNSGALNPDELDNYDIIVSKDRLRNVLPAATSGIQDLSLLDQIDDAYEAGRDSQIFDSLKYAPTAEALAAAIKGELGLDLFANFTKQNFDVIKSANRQINATLNNNTDEHDLRIMAGYDFYGRKQDATAYLADYEDQAHSVFGLIDKKYNNNFRYGIGALITKYNSDYKDETTSRDEIMVQLLAPMTFRYGNTKLISVPRLGIGFGEYQRQTSGSTYKGDVTNYYYGITNEAHHTFDMGWFGLEPTLEFNVLGMYQGKIKEKDSALEVAATNNISVETGIGLYAVKEFELGEKGKINLRAGGTYYHELADPFKAQKARMTDAGLNYHVNSYDARRSRAVLSLRLDYRYKQFNLYSEFSKYIEDEDAYAINAGLGYKF